MSCSEKNVKHKKHTFFFKELLQETSWDHKIGGRLISFQFMPSANLCPAQRFIC